MKVWQKYLKKAKADLTLMYKKVANGGDCKGIACRFCPILDSDRPCEKIPFQERVAIWNSEAKDD